MMQLISLAVMERDFPFQFYVGITSIICVIGLSILGLITLLVLYLDKKEKKLMNKKEIFER